MNYPTVLKTGALKEIFSKIKYTGTPAAFSAKHLKSLGFTSSNDVLDNLKSSALVSGTDHAPMIIQCVRKYLRDNGINAEIDSKNLREKLGFFPIFGALSKNRIMFALGALNTLNQQEVARTVDYVIKEVGKSHF